MFKYLFDYVVLLLIFIMDDLFLFISPSFKSAIGYLPTLNMVGSVHILLIIPYTYLIVRILFIRKVDKLNNSLCYVNIRNKLIGIVTIINVLFTIVEYLISSNVSIWIFYTIISLIFMFVLKPKEESRNNLMKKNIKEYFKK